MKPACSLELFFPGGIYHVTTSISVLKTLVPGAARVSSSHGVSAGCLSAVLSLLVDRRGSAAAAADAEAFPLCTAIRLVAEISKDRMPFGIASNVTGVLFGLMTESDVAACLDRRLVLHSRTLLGAVRAASRFESRRDVIEAMLDSCYIPVVAYVGFRWRLDGIRIPPSAWQAAVRRARKEEEEEEGGAKTAVIVVTAGGWRGSLASWQSLFYRGFYADSSISCKPHPALASPVAGHIYFVDMRDASVVVQR
jgi:hypothetical protein